MKIRWWFPSMAHMNDTDTTMRPHQVSEQVSFHFTRVDPKRISWNTGQEVLLCAVCFTQRCHRWAVGSGRQIQVSYFRGEVFCPPVYFATKRVALCYWRRCPKKWHGRTLALISHIPLYATDGAIGFRLTQRSSLTTQVDHVCFLLRTDWMKRLRRMCCCYRTGRRYRPNLIPTLFDVCYEHFQQRLFEPLMQIGVFCSGTGCTPNSQLLAAVARQHTVFDSLTLPGCWASPRLSSLHRTSLSGCSCLCEGMSVSAIVWDHLLSIWVNCECSFFVFVCLILGWSILL